MRISATSSSAIPSDGKPLDAYGLVALRRYGAAQEIIENKQPDTYTQTAAAATAEGDTQGERPGLPGASVASSESAGQGAAG